MLAPQNTDQVQRMKTMIPEPLLKSAKLAAVVKELDEEVTAEYEYSLRKSIGGFTLTL